MSTQEKDVFFDYVKKRHSISKLHVHLIFTTKYRKKIFTDVMIQQLRDAFNSACTKMECELIEMDGEEDHVHLLVSYPPKIAISVLVNNLKSVSSRRIRIYNTHLTRLSKNSALWSRSYFACTTGGVTIEQFKVYIESQKTPS